MKTQSILALFIFAICLCDGCPADQSLACGGGCAHGQSPCTNMQRIGMGVGAFAKGTAIGMSALGVCVGAPLIPALAPALAGACSAAGVQAGIVAGVQAGIVAGVTEVVGGTQCCPCQ